jgi:hypothetical protein
MWKKIFEPQHLKWRWSFCLAIGIYLYLFVAVCEPFKDDKITYMWASFDAYTQHSLLNFTLTVLSCALPLIFLPHYFPNYFSSEKITLKRFSLWVLITALLIETGYFLVNHLFFHHDLNLVWFLVFMFKVTCTSFLFIGIPFLFVFLWVFDYFTNSQYKVLSHLEIPQLEDSRPSNLEMNVIELTDIIPPQYDGEKHPIVLHFNDVANKKQLNVPLDSLYYITSAQNYIEIIYTNQNGKLSNQLLRNTLKTVEEELMTDPDLPLVRCHKAFIVNYDKVLELRGTTKNAQFILADLEIKIPVSRHKFANFEGKQPFMVN